jgi:hypothetical protein
LIMYRAPLLALLIALLVVSHAAAQPASDTHCFASIPSIDNCIEGRFASFWNDNGGLPVFGYPITPQRNEPNQDLQGTFLTQWFERNRFELHPENQAPYDVLLGRLGAELLEAQGRDWHNEPNDGNPLGGNCRHFEQTNREVCGPFLQFWQEHGLADPSLDADGRSLALFGLPLTGVKLEQSPNGNVILTQWFERARFELHPEAGYTVLLGLVGNEWQNKIMPTVPQNTDVHVFEPFDNAGRLNPALRTISTEQGSCWTDSAVSNRADAWRCMAQSSIYDPCFQEPGAQPRFLVCTPDVWTGEVRVLRLTEPLPEHFGSVVLPSQGSIWEVALATGERCRLTSGATDVVDDLRANYYCVPANPAGSTWIYGDVDQTTSPWTVRVWRKAPTSPPSSAALEIVSVTAAWR